MDDEFNPSWINVLDKRIMEFTISFPLGSCVSGRNHIRLEMSDIQSTVGFPTFCVG